MTYISQNTPFNQTQIAPTISRVVDFTAAMLRRFLGKNAAKAALENLSDTYLRDVGLTRNDVSSIDRMQLPSAGAVGLIAFRKCHPGNW
ncbi:hypothetical protein FGK63_08420 [Ruegeria sediminis]|uniref:DUF1127 domain-containing protein n=1 Tax=Ruegeria sediminis TaxID=2583820 RepID=A0ABY2X2H5_9RHOB|nr:hypothetical protein [Ruegeria sediminis]TMV09124.1 hypothetical protein FGK63_08420 [Ruegeria sediminis]